MTSTNNVGINSGGGVQTRYQSRHPQALQYFTEGIIIFYHIYLDLLIIIMIIL